MKYPQKETPAWGASSDSRAAVKPVDKPPVSRRITRIAHKEIERRFILLPPDQR